MSDPDAKPAAPGVPSWQRAQPQPPAADAAETPTAAPGDAAAASAPDDLETARQFLEDEGVRDEPREKKVAFLKSKGFEDAAIEKLLDSSDDGTATSDTAESDAQTSDSTASTDQAPSTASTATTSPPPSSVSASSSVTTPTSTTTVPPTTAPASPAPQTNRPPIVTYPEFLAKPQRPPPLVTTDGLLNTLYAFAGLSTILYATSKFVLAPMVAAQTDARHDLHATTSRKLDALVAKLEKSVSEVPAAAKKRPGTTTGLDADAAADDDDSEAEDPTEMFHRDMGTQTTFPLGGAPPLSASTAATPSPPTPSEVAKRQAERVGGLSKSLAGLKDEIRSQSEGMDAIKTLVDEFRDDLDTLTFTADQGPAYDIYGRSRKPDPEDEMRKVRDSIRRVKGVLLSTRNFPASTR